MLAAWRRLAEKRLPREWDVLFVEQTTQTADAPALELHRAVAGASGEYRAGPVLPNFEALWAELKGLTARQLAPEHLRRRVGLREDEEQGNLVEVGGPVVSPVVRPRHAHGG